jgi:aminocarboxymuconate-semialdehyde decarboxylase
MANAIPVIVDIHTHMYSPPYIDHLKARTTVPYIRAFPDAPDDPRLIILASEEAAIAAPSSTSRGRPLGPAYSDIAAKLAFMDQHSITTSVLSLANPWLDFFAPGDQEAAKLCRESNIWFECACASAAKDRLFFFAALPLSAGIPACLEEIKFLATQSHVRGIILSTAGTGSGLDDSTLDPFWSAIAEAKLPIFIHPHHGLPREVFGPDGGDRYGHVLPLALGFPLETTIAASRMVLSGVFVRHPALKVLLAHAGGALPFLAGRLQSCVDHDSHLLEEGTEVDVWQAFKENIYLDAVTYSEASLKCAVETVGAGKVMFGTDHPFFPPLKGAEQKWASVTTNIVAAKGLSEEDRKKVLGGNAIGMFDLRPAS